MDNNKKTKSKGFGTQGVKRDSGKTRSFNKGKEGFKGDKKPFGDRKSYRDKPEGKREFGNKPRGFSKSGDGFKADKKPFGDRKPYGDKPEGKREFGDKPRSFSKSGDGFKGDKKTFGDRKPYRDKQEGKRESSDKPRNFNKLNEDFKGDRKPRGDRPDVKNFKDKQSGFKPQQIREEDQTATLSRLTAFRILQDITVRKAYTALAINNVLKTNRLKNEDKRLATNIVYTTLENLYLIDHVLDSFMETPTTDPILRDVLRLSLAQIMFMDRVPDSAAVNEGVKLIRLVSTVEPWAGLVNGVLRNIVRSKDNLPLPKEEDDPDFYLSIMHSTPLWLVKRLKELFGEKEAKEIISYKNKTNTTCLRPNFMNISKEAFEEMLKNKGWEYTNGILPNAYLVKGVESIAEDADYLSGKYSVQGQSSMLVVEAMDNKPGMYVLDACAAPGGKALYLAEKQQGSGRVYAWDIHNHRVDLIRSQMYRLSPGNVRVANCDARVYRDDMYKFFDAVLVDVPCSNTGVILDKPDVKYNLKADEMPSLLDLQADILDNCAKYVKPGGVLIYSTCSIMPEENEQQVKKFLENNPNFKITSFPENFPENLARQTGDYGLQILPHKTGLEGFFIARMVRDNEY